MNLRRLDLAAGPAVLTRTGTRQIGSRSIATLCRPTMARKGRERLARWLLSELVPKLRLTHEMLATVTRQAGYSDTAAIGAEGVCFDASALIDLGDAGVLNDVAGWFPRGSCHTSPVVVERELASSLAKYPQNEAIVRAPWLRQIPVESDDFQYLNRLRIHFGGRRGRGEGEAEVLTLCSRHGWTAVINDRQGRVTAAADGIAAVCTAGLIVAAAAYGVVSASDGWDLHRIVHADHVPSLLRLGVTKPFEAIFHKAVELVQRETREPEGGEWPGPLAHPSRLDVVVERFVRTEAPTALPT